MQEQMLELELELRRRESTRGDNGRKSVEADIIDDKKTMCI